MKEFHTNEIYFTDRGTAMVIPTDQKLLKGEVVKINNQEYTLKAVEPLRSAQLKLKRVAVLVESNAGKTT